MIGNLIYQPKGKALEYAPLACNVYRGCDHACVYCYAPLATHRERVEFNVPSTRSADFLAKLEKEATKQERANHTGQVLLSFTCDPYQTLDVTEGVTREVITILHRHCFDVAILTKGGERALRDIELLTPRDAFACTLTTLDDAESLKWEPGAALPADRIATLELMHDAGIPTWVSLEPVFSPEQVYAIIARTAHCTDLYKVGKLNYHPVSREINWRVFAAEVVRVLQLFDKQYYIKEDLRPFCV